MVKKGQVTVYIIIGLLLLAVLIILLKIRSIESPEPEFVVTNSNEVEIFVSNCLSQAAKNAFIEIGLNGGNLYADYSGAEFLDASIPYWWHMSDEDTCVQECEFSVEGLPYLYEEDGPDSIEEQAAVYIEKHIGNCLDGFSQLKKKSYIIEVSGPLDTEVDIARKNILLKLNYPVSVQQGDNHYFIEEFRSTLELDFEHIYRTAINILAAEIEFKYFEHLTRSLITGYSATEKSSLPPIHDFRFNDNKHISWSKNEVAGLLDGVLSANMQNIRVSGSSNIDYNDPSSFLFTLPANISYPYDVNFHYADPFYMDIYPRSGDRIAPSNQAEIDMLGFMRVAMEEYKFSYDVSYPLVVDIYDSRALAGSGYSFLYALEVNMRNNLPLASNERIYTLPDQASQCSVEDRHSGNITIQITDEKTTQPVDADVFYGIKPCYIDTARAGLFNSRLPVCEGCNLIAKMDGYESFAINLNTRLDTPVQLQIELVPLSSMIIEINKSDGLPLSDNEKVFLNLEKIIGPNDAESKSLVVEFTDKTERVLIAPGNYRLTAQIFDSTEFTLPAMTNQNVDYPAQDFSGYITGQLVLDNLSLTRNHIDTGILITIPYEGRPMTWLDIVG